MPWREVTPMSERAAFVQEARAGANFSQLCARYGISRKTGYKWLERHQALGAAGLEAQSRRPHASPQRTAVEVENRILAVREAHPTWGGRKIKAALARAGHPDVPSASTITAILHRYGHVSPEASRKRQPPRRFEYAYPNGLWQMDFKGPFALKDGSYSMLTIIDDHSRYLLCAQLCQRQTRAAVQANLQQTFTRHGLPERFLCDNAKIWSGLTENSVTKFEVGLMRLGIHVYHGRPYHPQTQGKVERVHRTVGEDVFQLLNNPAELTSTDFQHALDRFSNCYNFERPHEALDMAVPADRYQPSPRSLPATLPPIRYAADYIVRKVDRTGRISILDQRVYLGRALRLLNVGLLHTQDDDVFDVFFCQSKLMTIRLEL